MIWPVMLTIFLTLLFLSWSVFCFLMGGVVGTLLEQKESQKKLASVRLAFFGAQKK